MAIDMTQLLVTIEDMSLLPDIKKAISLLRGVTAVNTEEVADALSSAEALFDDTTLEAMRDAVEGRTIKCDSFEDYLEKVR